MVAQKRLARGLRLNHPEAVALISTVLMELIREGKSVAELMDTGRRILGKRQVGKPREVQSAFYSYMYTHKYVYLTDAKHR